MFVAAELGYRRPAATGKTSSIPKNRLIVDTTNGEVYSWVNCFTTTLVLP